MSRVRFRITIKRTRKTYGPKSEYYRTGESEEWFNSIEEAKEWIKVEYGGCKKQKMYVGDGEHIGYIYCFKTNDYFDDDKKLLAQDWVTAYKVDPIILR